MQLAVKTRESNVNFNWCMEYKNIPVYKNYTNL